MAEHSHPNETQGVPRPLNLLEKAAADAAKIHPDEVLGEIILGPGGPLVRTTGPDD
jgi:hypothetical protein